MTVLRALIPLILVGIMVFSVVDIITMVENRVRFLPKLAWIFIVILLSVIGSLLWFFLGREPLEPRTAGGRPAPRRGPRAPDDDPEFLGKLARDREQEERIRNLEERLRELGDDDQQRPTG